MEHIVSYSLIKTQNEIFNKQYVSADVSLFGNKRSLKINQQRQALNRFVWIFGG